MVHFQHDGKPEPEGFFAEAGKAPVILEEGLRLTLLGDRW